MHLTRVSALGAVLAVCGLCLPTQAVAQQHTKWYLAEGAANGFFQEEILIANPNAAQANVTVTFLKSDGQKVPVQIPIPATSRHTLRVNSLPGFENVNASAVVTSDINVAVERTMYWAGSGQRRGGHNATGISAPAVQWYLAEGSLGFFDTYILLGNPDETQAADVTVRLLPEFGAPIDLKCPDNGGPVPAGSRCTIPVHLMAPQAGNFSAVVNSTNGVPIIAERAMYWAPGIYEGGHDAVGVTATSATWRFAEGFTGSGFATYFLVNNPNPTPVTVNVTFLFDGGVAPGTHSVVVAPNSRKTIPAHELPGMQDKAFGTLIQTAGGEGIVAERAMYWGQFTDGHATAGLTTEGLKWAFAEGLADVHGPAPSSPAVQDSLNYETFYLFANSSAQNADVRATFYREDGTGIQRTITVPARGRATVSPVWFPELSNQKFAAFFESTNGVPVIAERAVYWGPDRTGGHVSTGMAWDGAIAAPPAPPQATITSVLPNAQERGGLAVVVGTNFPAVSVVLIGGIPAMNSRALDRGAILFNVPPTAPAGRQDVTVRTPFGDIVLPGGFTVNVNAPPPPPPPNRAADPAPGQLLPLPNMEHIVHEVAAQFPGALRNSCLEHGGNWDFMDRLVDRLRQFDTRWGYNCKRGNCPDISQDVVAYHAGTGPDVDGVNQTFTVDVISGHCGNGNPAPWWSPHAYIPGPGEARWHGRFRF